MLETALTSGLVSMGMDVLLVGPLPTPAVAHLTKSMGAAAGVMITASHNPYEDNGMKIFGPDGYKLSDDLEALIERHILGDEPETPPLPPAQIGKAHRIDDARSRYIELAKQTADSFSRSWARKSSPPASIRTDSTSTTAAARSIRRPPASS
jgi:phosphoglucosamine mutase